MMINDEQGKPFPAITVFSESIRFLKDHLMNEIMRKVFPGTDDTDIDWVVTIPAVKKESAKEFMILAAKQVCIIFSI